MDSTRFFKSYYIVNCALIASYWLVRSWFLDYSDKKYSKIHSEAELEDKEHQAFTLLAIALAIKFVRRQSLDAFFSDAFFFSKSVIALMSFYLDYRILVYYILMYLVLALLCPQPIFSGPSNIDYLNPASFGELVEKHKDSGVSWIIEFYAPWAEPCIFLEPVIAGLSLKYSSPTLKFGKIDVSRWPSMGKRFNVDISKGIQQLPTLIMFTKGKEVGRIPHVFEDGSIARGKFRKGDIIQAFNLDSPHPPKEVTKDKRKRSSKK